MMQSNTLGLGFCKSALLESLGTPCGCRRRVLSLEPSSDLKVKWQMEIFKNQSVLKIHLCYFSLRFPPYAVAFDWFIFKIWLVFGWWEFIFLTYSLNMYQYHQTVSGKAQFNNESSFFFCSWPSFLPCK